MQDENRAAAQPEMGDIQSEREEKRQEIENNFSLAPFQVVRKELFAHLRDPQVTIRNGSIAFNSACIKGLEDAVYVKLMVSQSEMKLAVRKCNEDDTNALRWCVAKDDKRKSRKMTCPGFTDLIYEMMGWDRKRRYKILGYRIHFEGDVYYVFDLSVSQWFHEKTKKGDAPEVLEEEEEPVNTRKGFYSEEVSGQFGLSVEEDQKLGEVTEQDGYVSMAMLTGIRREPEPQGAGKL